MSTSPRAEAVMLARAILLLGLIIWPDAGSAQTSSPPLVLETKIPLGEVSGRIDHLGVDLKRQRLFVAELGNNSLGVVDLAAGKMVRTIGGMSLSRRVSPMCRLPTNLCGQWWGRVGAGFWRGGSCAR